MTDLVASPGGATPSLLSPLTDPAGGSALTRLSAFTAQGPVRRVLREGGLSAPSDHTSLVDRQGIERPISHSAAPVRGPDGELQGVVLVFRDMTAEVDGLIMAASHRTLPVHGVQFHPESIASEHGATMCRNFLDLAADWAKAKSKPAA